MLTLAIRRSSRLVLALALLALSGGCGSATVGIIAGSGGGGGGTTPTITAFDVPNPKTSPARLHVEASAGVTAELFYARAGGAETPLSALSGPGVAGNQVALAAGPNDLTWDFAAELGSPDYEPAVDLIVKRPGGAPISGGSLHLGMGNDPPVVLLVDPMPTDPADPSESSGNVEVRLGVSDSSSDVVAIHVEWRRASDAPDAWQPATAAGVFPAGVETTPEPGVTLSFFWNTNVDLADGDDDVVLRATADDGTLDPDDNPIGVSDPLESVLLHVDNNAAPIVQLLYEAVLANPDDLRGIPVPVRVIDEEGDPVQLVLQWRREGEAFPDLPADEAALDSILADADQRREKQVCTEFPRFAQGKAVPIDASSLRLSELATSETWAVVYGLEGQTLELLRPRSIPAPITPSWSANPLAGPVAALPLGDGLSALVLDAPGSSWRLREIELATGRVKPDAGSILASAAGAPSAMALEHGEKAVLVASDVGGSWRIERVELASGALTALAVSDGSEPGPVRGIASRGTATALFTVGSSLFQLDYHDLLPPRHTPLLRGLDEPWGVALDPLAPNRCYVSERGANRVLALELDTHAVAPVVVKTADGQLGELVEPGALAFVGTGPRLLVVTAAPGGGEEITGLDLGAQGGNVAFLLGESHPSGIASVASGPDGLRLAAIPGADELLVAGGLEQRRTILALDPQSPPGPREQLAVVDRPFDPAPSPNQPWRIPLGSLVHASQEGVVARFVWDSSDAHTGSVFLRALGRDDERGPPAEAAATKFVRPPLAVEPLIVGNSGLMNWLAVGDLDGDGDEDLVTVSSGGSAGDTLDVFFQDGPGSFSSPPLVLGSPGQHFDVFFVALGDLDEDRDLDIAVAGDVPAIFYQEAPGSFGPPQALPGPMRTRALAIGDLDGDGDQDILATADLGTAVLLQAAPGVFGTPQVIGPPGGFGRAVALDDLDGDGDLDVVAATSAGPTILFQAAPGSFGPPQVIDDRTFRFVAVGDLDGDGDQDIVAALEPSRLTVAVYFQQAPGNYSPPLDLLSVANLGDPAIGDLDGDGDQDIACGESVFFQRAPGLFLDEPAVLASQGIFLSSTVLCDVDGDGAADLVATDRGQRLVYLQAAPGTFEPPERPTLTTSVEAALGDVDGDGDQDLVLGTNDVEIFLQGSPRSFGAPPIALGERHPTGAVWTMATGDLDGDGDQDIVGHQGTDDLMLFFQGASGAWTPFVLSTPAGAGAPAIGDLDCDGDQDIASANRLGVTVFLQEALGAWASFVLSVPDGAVDPAIGDLDGDGDQDIVAGTRFPSIALTVWLQECPGAFSAPQLLIGVAGSPAIEDMNGDGEQDIVSVTGAELRIHFQGPPGSFAPPLVLDVVPVTDGVTDAAIGDLDGDGDLDIVVVEVGGGASNSFFGLTAFHQGAPGTFGPPRRLTEVGTSTGSFRYVATTDLDGDGELDVLGGLSLDTVLWGGR